MKRYGIIYDILQKSSTRIILKISIYWGVDQWIVYWIGIYEYLISSFWVQILKYSNLSYKKITVNLSKIAPGNGSQQTKKQEKKNQTFREQKQSRNFFEVDLQILDDVALICCLSNKRTL